MTNSQVGALDERSVDIAAQTCGFEAGAIVGRQAPDETLLDINDAQAMSVLDYLPIHKVRQEHPDWLLLAFDRDPLAKLGSEGIVVMFQTIGTGNGNTARPKPGLELMNHSVSHGLIARTELENGDQLGFGIADGPDPDLLLGMFDACP